MVLTGAVLLVAVVRLALWRYLRRATELAAQAIELHRSDVYPAERR